MEPKTLKMSQMKKRIQQMKQETKEVSRLLMDKKIMKEENMAGSGKGLLSVKG